MRKLLLAAALVGGFTATAYADTADTNAQDIYNITPAAQEPVAPVEETIIAVEEVDVSGENTAVATSEQQVVIEPAAATSFGRTGCDPAAGGAGRADACSSDGVVGGGSNTGGQVR
jgi:hypothetical protein